MVGNRPASFARGVRCPECGRGLPELASGYARCRRRACPSYSHLWAGDQRRKLFENLSAYEGDLVVVLAVTAPGADELPWDVEHCAVLGAHHHSGKLGCRVARRHARAWNETASARWRTLHRRAYQEVRRRGVRPTMLVRAFERQHRGVLHVHPVLAFTRPDERYAAHLYAAVLAKLSPRYGFGFTERRLRPISRRGAAAYLSAYFVTGKRGKQTLQESVLSPDMPRSIIHVSTKLTQQTGVTMRELRFRRFVFHIARRCLCDLEEARTIALLAQSDALDLSVDAFSPSPRFLASVLGREPPPRVGAPAPAAAGG